MNEHQPTSTPAATAYAAALAEDHAAQALRADLRALRAEAHREREEVAARRAEHERELTDVEELNGLGPRALLAALRGTRHPELQRERSEEARARTRAVTALERLHEVEGRAEEVDRRLARLGDTALALEDAATAYAEELRGSTHPVAAELDGLLTELAAVRERIAAVERAREAGARAAGALEAARADLSRASGWSAYDTFAGGGMIASAIKHQHADSASRSIANAQHALVEFAGALGSLGDVAGLRADLGIGRGLRTVDVWLDNLVTDLVVRSRIKDGVAAVDRAATAVREGLDRTALEHGRLTARAEELVRRRDGLLGAAR